MTTRRGFLSMMLGAAAAPAIVKAESLMKIVVPKKEIILPQSGDWTADMWGGSSCHPPRHQMYMNSMPNVAEDGIVISESSLRKLEFQLYEPRHVQFGNDRSYPLNPKLWDMLADNFKPIRAIPARWPA